MLDGYPDAAPRPDNFEAMAAAWADPVQWSIQVGIYNAQLVDAGLETVPPTMSYAHAKHVFEHDVGREYRDDGTVD